MLGIDSFDSASQLVRGYCSECDANGYLVAGLCSSCYSETLELMNSSEVETFGYQTLTHARIEAKRVCAKRMLRVRVRRIRVNYRQHLAHIGNVNRERRSPVQHVRTITHLLPNEIRKYRDIIAYCESIAYNKTLKQYRNDRLASFRLFHAEATSEQYQPKFSRVCTARVCNRLGLRLRVSGPITHKTVTLHTIRHRTHNRQKMTILHTRTYRLGWYAAHLSPFYRNTLRSLPARDNYVPNVVRFWNEVICDQFCSLARSAAEHYG